MASLRAAAPAPFASAHSRASSTRRSGGVRVMASAKSFHDFKAKRLDGSELDFSSLKGKVVLVTNVACACGYTNSNYKELVELQKKYGAQGLEIQAWPCNQFGAQESGSAEQIRSFVDGFGVEFTMMEKVDVNGANTHPVWAFLKESNPGDVRWNFAAKFIVGKDGKVVSRNSDSPLASEAQIKELLAA